MRASLTAATPMLHHKIEEMTGLGDAEGTATAGTERARTRDADSVHSLHSRNAHVIPGIEGVWQPCVDSSVPKPELGNEVEEAFHHPKSIPTRSSTASALS